MVMTIEVSYLILGLSVDQVDSSSIAVQNVAGGSGVGKLVEQGGNLEVVKVIKAVSSDLAKKTKKKGQVSCVNKLFDDCYDSENDFVTAKITPKKPKVAAITCTKQCSQLPPPPATDARDTCELLLDCPEVEGPEVCEEGAYAGGPKDGQNTDLLCVDGQFGQFTAVDQSDALVNPIFDKWLSNENDVTLTEYYPNSDLIVQVLAIADPDFKKDCMRLSDGEYWLEFTPSIQIIERIKKNDVKVGDLVKIRKTSGSPSNKNFQLVSNF